MHEDDEKDLLEDEMAAGAATGEEETDEESWDPGEPAEAGEAGPDVLPVEMERLKKEARESREKYLRKCADLENYKKRAQKEKTELANFSNEVLLKELLPVIDNLERALEHFEEEKNSEGQAAPSLKEGVELTLKSLFGVLDRFGLKEVNAIGERFDPTLHEALAHEESEGAESEVVTKQLQKGYLLKGRLLRPALVIVAK